MSRIYQSSSSTTKTSTSSLPTASTSTKTSSVTINSSSSSSSANVSPTVSLNNLTKSMNNTNTISDDNSKLNEKMEAKLNNLINRLEIVTNRLESVGKSSNLNGSIKAEVNNTMNGRESSPVESIPPCIQAFDDLITNSFQPFKSLSATISEDVKQIVELVEKLFKQERTFLLEAVRSVQPTQDALMSFFKSFSKLMEEIQTFREKNRRSLFFNHLSAVSESIGAFGWISVQPTPIPFIKEMTDSAQFYTNRVLKDYKEKDANHINWSKQWIQVLTDLQAYVKQHHTTGVTWNSTKSSKVFDASHVLAGEATSQSKPTPGPKPTLSSSGPGLPPPPPPPVPNFGDLLASDSSVSSTTKTTPNPDALFAEINRGSDITKHLKKVADDQKTHKNPNLRASSTVPGETVRDTGDIKAKTPIAVAAQKSSVFELVEKKWKVEYMQGRHDLVIDQTDLKHTIYIYQCKECTITVKGKVNSISLDSCSRVGVLFDDVLSTVEFINCKNVQMQVLGKVPTVNIEKTDGCQVYLSRNSLQTEVVSSKSSSMNLLIPNQDDDEFTEQPVPEQFKTTLNMKTRKLVTNPTEIA